MCKARSWALWWTGLCSGVSVGPGVCWWVGLGPSAKKLDGGFQTGACQPRCPRGGRSSSQVAATSVCNPRVSSRCHPASLGGSPRSAGGSDPGSFQITASVLGPRACKMLCAPFKSGVSISHSPLALLKASPSDLHSQMFWGFSSWQDP